MSDGYGGAIVVWRDDRALNEDIYAQRISRDGVVSWTADGVAISSLTDDQDDPELVSDGEGGAIIVWRDEYRDPISIYAQRIDGSGIALWTTNGIPVATASHTQAFQMIVSDDAGGVIIAWEENRVDWNDIVAQRLDPDGNPLWGSSGLVLCSAAQKQERPCITTDGKGGAIVCWSDDRDRDLDIYAQRVDATGTVRWTADGVAIRVSETYEQTDYGIASDLEGGAVIVWKEGETDEEDIYAQRVDSLGNILWTPGGVQLCSDVYLQVDPSVAADGEGGFYVVWIDYGGLADLKGQHLDSSGNPLWAAGGIVLSSESPWEAPQIMADGYGGAIISWSSLFAASRDILATRIESDGTIVDYEPEIISVEDVPGDDGGWVRLTIDRSILDNEFETEYPVTMYKVWQRIDGASPAPPVKDGGEVEFASAGDVPPGEWEVVGSFAAGQLEEYIYRSATLADSTVNGIAWSVFFVSAHTSDPATWFSSEVDSGYSVDDKPPKSPAGMYAELDPDTEALIIRWKENEEEDLLCYRLYRGMTEDFELNDESLVAQQKDTRYLDREWSAGCGFHYKLTAVDIHGNESDQAVLTSPEVDGPSPIPVSVYLKQNYPNPFNPLTTIKFGLDRKASVELSIYDAAGRKIRTVLSETLTADHYSMTWDGRSDKGQLVAAGVYFIRMNAGRRTITRKMVLCR